MLLLQLLSLHCINSCTGTGDGATSARAFILMYLVYILLCLKIMMFFLRWLLKTRARRWRKPRATMYDFEKCVQKCLDAQRATLKKVSCVHVWERATFLSVIWWEIMFFFVKTFFFYR